MDLTDHTLATLFAQLGLASGDNDIAEFVSTHKLSHDMHLLEAGFWNDGQRAFLEEALADDSDWTELVEHLDAMLRD